MSTVAEAENVTPAYIRRMLKLAYMAPVVLEKIPIERLSPAMSLKDMATAAELPWAGQATEIFGADWQFEKRPEAG